MNTKNEVTKSNVYDKREARPVDEIKALMKQGKGIYPIDLETLIDSNGGSIEVFQTNDEVVTHIIRVDNETYICETVNTKDGDCILSYDSCIVNDRQTPQNILTDRMGIDDIGTIPQSVMVRFDTFNNKFLIYGKENGVIDFTRLNKFIVSNIDGIELVKGKINKGELNDYFIEIQTVAISTKDAVDGVLNEYPNVMVR